MVVTGVAEALHLQFAGQAVEVKEDFTSKLAASRCRFWRLMLNQSEQVPLLTGFGQVPGKLVTVQTAGTA